MPDLYVKGILLWTEVMTVVLKKEMSCQNKGTFLKNINETLMRNQIMRILKINTILWISKYIFTTNYLNTSTTFFLIFSMSKMLTL